VAWPAQQLLNLQHPLHHQRRRQRGRCRQRLRYQILTRGLQVSSLDSSVGTLMLQRLLKLQHQQRQHQDLVTRHAGQDERRLVLLHGLLAVGEQTRSLRKHHRRQQPPSYEWVTSSLPLMLSLLMLLLQLLMFERAQM